MTLRGVLFFTDFQSQEARDDSGGCSGWTPPDSQVINLFGIKGIGK